MSRERFEFSRPVSMISYRNVFVGLFVEESLAIVRIKRDSDVMPLEGRDYYHLPSCREDVTMLAWGNRFTCNFFGGQHGIRAHELFLVKRSSNYDARAVETPRILFPIERMTSNVIGATVSPVRFFNDGLIQVSITPI